MDIVTIIEIGMVTIAVGVSAYQSIAHAQARTKLDRARAFYENQKAVPIDDTMRPAFTQGDREKCGGCGANLTPDQLAECKGEECPLYIGGLNTVADQAQQESQAIMDEMFGHEVNPYKKPKKINIGFTGHLHTDR